MGLRFPAQIHGQCFFVTTTFRNWRKLGAVAGIYQKLAESLVFCAEKYEALIAGYVFMPSHIHILIFIEGKRLSGFMRDFKKYISQKTVKELGLNMDGVWMPRYDRVAITSKRLLASRLEYIHNNPVKAQLVDAADAWRWSSASEYIKGASPGNVPIFRDWI
jgi:putative transposase